MAPERPDGTRPLREVSWSKRGLKTIYVKPADKLALQAAATAEGFPTVRDYIMHLHKARQQK